MKSTTDSRTLAALAVALVLWASAFAAIRAALVSYGPGELALLRFLTASIVLGIYATISRMSLPKLRDLPIIALLGILGITGYHLSLNVGEMTVTAGSASMLIAVIWLGEIPTWLSLLGGGLSISGVLVANLRSRKKGVG